jgi:propionyl-CoA synthetase
MILDEAILKSGISESTLKCIIFNRPEETSAKLSVGRDADWNDLLAGAREYGDCQPVEANHPLYLIYTSGRIFVFCSSDK